MRSRAVSQLSPATLHACSDSLCSGLLTCSGYQKHLNYSWRSRGHVKSMLHRAPPAHGVFQLWYQRNRYFPCLVLGTLLSRWHPEITWKFVFFFLLCKRFPGWQWVNLPVCESLFQGTAVLKLISLVFLRTDAVRRTISMGNNVLQEFNGKGWDVLLGSCFGVWEGGLPFFTLFLRLAESIRLWNM